MKLNFESLEMQKWIMLMDRTQKVDGDLFLCFHVYSWSFGSYI